MKKSIIAIMMAVTLVGSSLAFPVQAYAREKGENVGDGEKVEEIYQGEVVDLNKGEIETNNGTVKANGVSILDTIITNNGTVETNFGTVKNNYGTVTKNEEMVENNYGTVTENNLMVRNNNVEPV